MGDYWAIRYNAARLPPQPLHLEAPLTRAWKYRPKGSLVGFTRAGDGAVFTTGGKGPVRLDLETGKPSWAVSSEADLLIPWCGDLLAWNTQGLRVIDAGSGKVKWTRDVSLGMDSSCTVDDLLIGVTPEALQVIDLVDFERLWRVEGLVLNPPASDGRVVIRADDDVTCFDVRSGAVHWIRSKSEYNGKPYQMGFIWRDRFVVRIGEPLLLTALDLTTGNTVWTTDFSVTWCQPYGDHAYGVGSKGVYRAVDLATGEVSFEIQLDEVPEPREPKSGLMVSRESGSWPWRDARVAVSETHAFVSKPSGQIVVLGRDTGEIVQVMEIEGMPVGRSEPIIYENRLLVADFNAAVYCFEGQHRTCHGRTP